MRKSSSKQPIRGKESGKLQRRVFHPFVENWALLEINILKHPLTLLSENNLPRLLQEAARQGKSHIHYEIVDPDGSRHVWIVSPNVKSGYLSPFDKKVIMTVLKLVTEEGFPPPFFWKLGSVRRICQRMGLPDSGKNLRRVRESLVRVSDTKIYTDHFYLKGEDSYWQEFPDRIGGNFSLWEVYWRGATLPDGEVADGIYLQFNVPFILSLQEYYIKPIDYEYWLTLTPLAQRLYEVTGIKFYGLQDSEYVAFDYLELCQVLPLKPQKYLSKAKTVLEPAHRLLKETGWLARVDWRVYRKRSEAQGWRLRYWPGPRAKEELERSSRRLLAFLRKGTREKDEALISALETEVIVREIIEVTGDTKSYPYFWKIARRVPREAIFKALSEIKADYVHNPHAKVKKSLGAIFVDKIKRYCQENGLTLS